MASTAQARAGYRAVLHSGDLTRLLGSELISSSGGWAYNVALMVFLYDRTHSASWVARLAFTHPSSRVLQPLLQTSPDPEVATTSPGG
jgi:hypothetical protein